jgi:SagB-type dehydrogenase family enzyme
MNSAGEIRRLAEPRPRKVELPFERYRFPVRLRRLLSVPKNVASATCLDILHRRRSRRRFGPLAEEQLSTLLWFTAKTLRTERQTSGFAWQHRPAPSSGGRHPIYILLLTPAIDPTALSVYEPEGHALLDLEPVKAASQRAFVNGLESVLPPQSGTVLWFAADFFRTATRYECCESLLWRDAGAVFATINIAAEALGLNCCAYGVTGDAWLAKVLPRKRFLGVGGCVVGLRT